MRLSGRLQFKNAQGFVAGKAQASVRQERDCVPVQLKETFARGCLGICSN